MIITRKRRFDVYMETVREVSALPFEYGSNDCLLFVSRAVHRLIGVDHAQTFLPYNAKGAHRIVRRAGGMAAFMSMFIGQPEESLDGVRMCDPVLVDAFGAHAAGLWNGSRATVLKEGGGVMVVMPEHVIASWRVG